MCCVTGRQKGSCKFGLPVWIMMCLVGVNACCLASLGDEGMASLGGGLVAASQCDVPHCGMTRTVSVVAEEEGSTLTFNLL